jgi:hypothetical protein
MIPMAMMLCTYGWQPVLNVSYRKRGGLHFVRAGRFGCSFYLARRIGR